jgi:signal transduction histidine kinase
MTTLERSTDQLVHELRNRLNSLLMNAAVLRSRLPESERDSPYARHLEEDGMRCAELIHALDESLQAQEIVNRK